MLNIFRGKQTSPSYRLVPPPGGELEVLTCHESVSNHMVQVFCLAEKIKRQRKSVLMCQELSSAMSNSRKRDMSPLLLFRTSYTKIWLDSGLS